MKPYKIPRGGTPKYLTADDLAEKIDQYFSRSPRYPTIQDLCLFLGFSSRQSFYDYEKKSSDFSYVVNYARLQLVHSLSQSALSGDANPRISQLILGHNHQVIEKSQLDHTSKGKKMEGAKLIINKPAE